MRFVACIWLFMAIFVSLKANPANPPKPLQEFKDCTLVPTEWADGDSFRIRTKDGKEHTIRLYGADCLEWHVNDDADAQRLRKQRRYFGITEALPNPGAAIALAKAFGQKAADKTELLLKKPFTVHTYFRDALGDGQHPRVYGFVTSEDGKDLAEELVKSGLARAFGVHADGPGGRSPDDYKALLADLELQAAKRGLGIWKETNWEKLPLERLEQRKDDNQINAAIAKQPLPPGFKLDSNKAAMDDLLKLPKIGEVLANQITEGRPYKNLDDLDRVDGIGPKTLELLKPHLEFPESKQ